MLRMSYSVYPKSDLQSVNIGNRTRIWQYAVALPNAQIGTEYNICSRVLIENDVIVGDRVTLKSDMQLWDGLRIEDEVFFGPNVTFTNDPFPRSKQYPPAFLVTTVKAGASIGGGGDYPVWLSDRQRCHGGRRWGGNKVRTRPRGGRWQSCTHRPLPWGQR
jgi:acetyltransferase-like isoleucine patch superfamily enzyme